MLTNHYCWATLMLAILIVPSSGCSKQDAGEASAQIQQQISDATVTASIKTALALNEHVNAFDINIDTSSGVVTLRGEVETTGEKNLAGKIARATDNVKDVKNEITVNPQAAKREQAGSSAPSYGQKIRDASITASIESRYAWDRDVSSSKVEVDTQGGVVTLTGTVDGDPARKRAVRIAADTSGVREVRDQLQVTPAGATPAAPAPQGGGGSAAATVKDAAAQVAAGARSSGQKIAEGAKELGEKLSDAWITTKVKSALALNKNIDANQINVDTLNGEVTLRGNAPTDFAKKAAQEEAYSIRGVTKVNNMIVVQMR